MLKIAELREAPELACAESITLGHPKITHPFLFQGHLCTGPQAGFVPISLGIGNASALPSGNCGYTANDIYDRARLTVQDDNVRSNGSATVDYRQPRQAALKIWWERLHALLQTRRERAIALEMLLESRWQVPVPLCKSRWETRASGSKKVDDYLAIALAEDGLNLILVLFVRITAPLGHARRGKHSKSSGQQEKSA